MNDHADKEKSFGILKMKKQGKKLFTRNYEHEESEKTKMFHVKQ